MDGQSNTEPGIAGLAEFLSDEPEQESQEPQEEAEEIKDSDEQPESGTDEGEESEEDADPEEAEDQQPRKYKVTIKGEDGADVEQEVDEPELIAGYQRQADYTRKTQDLAKRESEAAQSLKSNHDQFLSEHVRQAEVAKQIVYSLAGVKTPQEMYELAHNDPAAAVAEQERQKILQAYIGQIDQYVSQISQKQQAESQQQVGKVQQAAWEKLSKENITREGLAKVYQDSIQGYGVNPQSLGSLYDPGIVLMMRDALAFRELKTKVPEATRKAHDAPRIPNSKQAPSKSDRRDVELEKKFKSGRAKLNDLAAYLR